MHKKKLFTSLLLLTVLFSCAPRYQEKVISCIQIVDRNGLTETITSQEKLKNYQNTNFDKPQSYKKVLRIFNKDNEGNIISKLTSYHDNGEPKQYLEIKNARAFGKYREWHPNGHLKIDAFVIGGSADLNQLDSWLFDGPSMVYDEKGHLISEFNYEKGYLNGTAKYYYPSLKIKKTIPYKNNEITGELTQYNSKGECISKINYVNGKKQGASIGFWSKDNISFMEEWENDLLMNAQYFKKSRIKASTIKNGDGQKAIFKESFLSELIEYKNGISEGRVQIFLIDGQLYNEYYQKDGFKDGLETQYYKEKDLPRSYTNKKNLPKLEISWDNGAINGPVKTWYKNGKLESQKEYSQNKKNGSHFAWYENGSVMFIEEYENDLLMKGSYFKINEKEPISTILKGNGVATLFDSQGRFIKKVNYNVGSLDQ